MAKLVLDDVGSTLTNTAATTINNNNTKIEQALENTLSRDGSTPNNMQADIDMDSNDLLNVGSMDVLKLTVGGVPVQAVGLANALKITNNLSDLSDFGAAQDNIQIGAVFADVATAQGATIPARNKRIRTQFYATANRIGGANYRRESFANLGGTPALAYFRSIDRFMPDGSTDSVNGGYWILNEYVKQPSMLGAKVDGTTNDTAACNASVSLGGITMFDAGVTASNQVTVSVAKTNILIPGTSTVKLFAGDTVDLAQFFFTSGAQGSYIGGGGLIDGNRAALLSFYLALPRTLNYGGTRYTIETEFDGVRAEPCADLTVENLTIANCMTHAITHRGGDRPSIRNIRVKDCTKVINAQFFEGGYIGDIQSSGIGNQVGGTAIPFWQPAHEFRDVVSCVFSNIVMKNFSPKVTDGVDAIGDPFPIAFTWERIRKCFIDTMDAGIYDYTVGDSSETGAAYGYLSSSVRNSTIRNLNSENYYWGEEWHTIDNSISDGGTHINVNGNTVPGAYAESAGVRIRGNGIYEIAGAVDSDYRANSTGRNISVVNKRCYGFTFGAKNFSGSCRIERNTFHGAEKHGIEIVKEEPNTTSFPAATALSIETILLANNDIQFNGFAGIHIVDGNDVFLSDNSTLNNGQRTSDGALASGILVPTIGSVKNNISISGGSSSDTQSFLKSKCASFIPGATDSKNRISMLMLDASDMGIGQHVAINNGDGAGNPKVRIVDIDRDVFIVETAVPITFSETGNLTAISGTWTNSLGGTTLTGVGGSAHTQIKGPVYLKIGSEYRRIAKVVDANTIQVTTPFSSAHTGASVSLVQCDVAGISSQKRPLYLSSNCQNVSWAGLNMLGNIDGHEFVTLASTLKPGQVFQVTREVNVNTAGIDTLIAPQVYTAADNVTPLEAAIIVTSALTGTDGTITVGFGTDTGFTSVKTLIPIAKNSKWNGATVGGIYTVDNLYPTCRIEGGADNIPSGGAVKASFLLRRMTVSAFPNVP